VKNNRHKQNIHSGCCCPLQSVDTESSILQTQQRSHCSCSQFTKKLCMQIYA